MYKTHFGLRSLPFEDRADPQFLFKTSECDELIAAMEYEIQYGRGMALILGEPGTGKTLLIRTLLLRLRPTDQVVVLTWAADSGMELIRETCKSFGVTLPSVYKPDRALARLRRHLRQSLKTGHRRVLIIDRAENLGSETLAQLDSLSGLYEDDTPLLSTILVGRPRLRATLDRPEFDGLKQRLFSERVVPHLLAVQTSQYILHRLAVAGAVDARIFDADAAALVHHASDGIPRLINRICDAALVAAYGTGRKRVTRGIIAEVTREQITHERSVDLREVGIQSGSELLEVPPANDGAVAAQRSAASTESIDSFSGTEFEFPDAASLDDELYIPLSGADEVPDRPVDYTARFEDRPQTASGHEIHPAILDRLERTIARAERVNSTTEATLTRFVAVEKHLTTLAANAESVMSGLNPALTRAGGTVERLQERVRRILVDAESRGTTLAATVTRSRDAVADTTEKAEFIEKACTRAERVEAHLAEFAEQLADKADGVQERMAQLMNSVQASDDAHTKLESLFEHVSTYCKESQEALEKRRQQNNSEEAEALRQAQEHRALLLEAVETCGRTQRQMTDDAVHEFRAQTERQLALIVQRKDQAIKEAQQSLRELNAETSTLSEGAAATLQKQRDGYKELVAQVESFHDQFVDRTIADYRSALKKELDTQYRLQTEMAAKARRELEVLDRQVSEASTGASEQLHQQLDTHRRNCEEVVTAARRALEELRTGHSASVGETADAFENLLQVHRRRYEEMAQGAEQRVESLQDQISTVVAEATATVDHGVARCQEDVTGILVQSRTRVDELRENLGALVKPLPEIQTSLEKVSNDVATAADRVHVLSDTVAELKGSIDEQVCRGDAVKEHLCHSIGDGERVLAEVRANCAKLDSLQSTITTTLVELGSAHERVRELRDEAVGADQVLGRLNSERQRGEQTIKSLDESARMAGHLRDDVHRLSIEVESKMGQLDSHNAAAQSVLQRLTDSNVAANALMAQANDAAQAAIEATTESKQEVDRRMQELRSQSATSRTHAEQLKASNEKASELLDVLERMLAPAAQVAEDLTAQLSGAREQHQELVEESAKATALADRLSPITEALEVAQAVEGSLRTMLQDAGTIHDGLSSLTDAARERKSQLADSNGAAEMLVEMQRTLMAESKNVAEVLADQLNDSASAAEEGRQYLAEFGRQVSEVEEQIQHLQRQTAQIQQQVGAAVAGPEEIVASARAQSEQLERVCRTVGKVFSGLAKATLVAKEQTEKCHDVGTSASRRLAELGQRTDQAANMLKEWTDEAIRIQERLQRTLESCPTIQQTHSRELLQALSSPPDADGKEPLGDISASSVQPLVSETRETPRHDVEIRLSPKAAEIAQLIEDAKRTSGIPIA